ncbi:hypothetical protein D3C76_1712390 [compost metagenome]
MMPLVLTKRVVEVRKLPELSRLSVGVSMLHIPVRSKEFGEPLNESIDLSAIFVSGETTVRDLDLHTMLH